MKLEYFDIKLDNLPMNQFIKKYELLIPQQKRAYNKELPENDEYLEDGDGEGVLFSDEPIKRTYYDMDLFNREETDDDLIVENFTPSNLEEEKEYKTYRDWSFDYHLTDKERSKVLYAGLNDGTIWLEYEHEADTISETVEDLNHEYTY